MKYYIILIAILIFFTACEETIELDPLQVEPRYVVESLITDQEKQHFVKLSKTTGFYDSGKTPRIDNASVKVTTDQHTYDFNYDAEKEMYISAEAFAGVANQEYMLQIDVDGFQITARDMMPSYTQIEDLTWSIDDDEKEDPEDPGYFYEMLVFAKEPQDTRDYYIFKFYRNDSIQNFDGRSVYFADDDMVKESINGLPAPVFYKEGDKATFEIYSVSREVYVFYADLNNVITNDGGMFSPQPANPRNNLSGDALGIFQVSSMATDSLLIGQ